MIEIKDLTKRFDDVTALYNLNLQVEDGTVTGLIGTNGGGKSTLLRLLSGVLYPDGGEVLIDGKRPFDNPGVKGECFFVADYPYFEDNATLKSTAALYRKIYPNWSDEEFERCCRVFPIDRKKNIITMSKGMQRQAALIIALATQPKYLFLDEIFDGLDAVMRLMLKKLLAECVADRKMTVIIASHTLRELEDLCDRVCLLHKGDMVLERELDALTGAYCKVQIGFAELPDIPEAELFAGLPVVSPEAELFAGLPVVSAQRNLNVFNITFRETEEDLMPKLEALNPAFISAIPLSLEEVFISEMEAAGYDAQNIG